MFAVAILHRFLVIPAFNKEEDLENKALMAFTSPLLAFLATSISQYLVLACPNPLLSDQNHNRMYVLVYFNKLLPLALFRVMQADFNDWGLFLGISLIYGFANLLSDATRELRKKMLERSLQSTECIVRRTQEWKIADRFKYSALSLSLRTDHAESGLHHNVSLQHVWYSPWRWNWSNVWSRCGWFSDRSFLEQPFSLAASSFLWPQDKGSLAQML